VFVSAPILVRPDFCKAFILNVNYSTKGVNIILFLKDRKKECVITYASKGLSIIQQRVHPMEGEYYALILGVMHFCQFLH
jgi:hypothetical protein